MPAQLYGFNAHLFSNLSEAVLHPHGAVGVAIMLQVSNRDSNRGIKPLTAQLKKVCLFLAPILFFLNNSILKLEKTSVFYVKIFYLKTQKTIKITSNCNSILVLLKILATIISPFVSILFQLHQIWANFQIVWQQNSNKQTHIYWPCGQKIICAT